jgi:hypothetical protein
MGLHSRWGPSTSAAPKLASSREYGASLLEPPATFWPPPGTWWERAVARTSSSKLYTAARGLMGNAPARAGETIIIMMRRQNCALWGRLTQRPWRGENFCLIYSYHCHICIFAKAPVQNDSTES